MSCKHTCRGDNVSYELFPDNRDTLYFSYFSYPQVPWDVIHTHVHSAYELIYVLEGDMTYVIEDRKYKVQKDDLIIVKPNQYHYIQFHSKQSYQRYSILFDPAALPMNDVCSLLPNQDILNCRHMPGIRELFQKMDHYYDKFQEPAITDLLQMLVKELVYNLGIVNNNAEGDRIYSAHPLVCRLLEVINKDIFGFDGIGGVANELYISEGYLYHLFKREMKVSPGRYVTEKRLLAARNLLLQGKSPTKIYAECGFSDYSSFFRSYTKFFGYPPSKEGQVK